MNALTVYVKIRPDGVEPLRRVLEAINADQQGNPYMRLGEDGLTHCSRWAIIEDDDGDAPS